MTGKKHRIGIARLVMTLVLFALLGVHGRAFAQSPPDKSASPTPKKILFLSPYQLDLPVNLLAVQVMREEFGHAADLKPDLFFEFLDLNRFPGDAYHRQLLSFFPAKYAGTSIDLVIVDGEGMLDFWLAHRDELLPNTPVVFANVDNRRFESRQLPPDVTGVSGSVDYMPCINWIMTARPSIKEIVIVHGVGDSDKEGLAQIDEMKTALRGRAQFADLSSLSMTEMKRRLAALPQSAVVLYHGMFEDADGVKHRPYDVLRELAGVSPAPIISGYDHLIGTGTVGGYMYSIEQQSRDAARAGLRILRGEPAKLIPISANQSNRFIFDHQALQRYGIGLGELPPGSIIKNRQYSAWELYRGQIIAICAGILSLLLLVLLLSVMTHRLSIARRALRRLNANLETQIQDRTAALVATNRSLEEEIVEHERAEAQLEAAVAELQNAMSKVRLLEGILPICSHCKKIRDVGGRWHMMETYVSKYSHAQFSHGLCPDCLKEHYSDLYSGPPEG